MIIHLLHKARDPMDEQCRELARPHTVDDIPELLAIDDNLGEVRKVLSCLLDGNLRLAHHLHLLLM